MIAAFHDVIITLPAPLFKEISLNVVAALLTLVGYSMNDTIVVLIEPARGQLSRRELNEQIVNDSVNQTLSRTIMVSGLTFVTARYDLRRAGTERFCFALVAGIVNLFVDLVASPILCSGTTSISAGWLRWRGQVMWQPLLTARPERKA